MVYIQIAGIRDSRSRICREPTALSHPALVFAAESNIHPAFCDQHLLPRVLTITIFISPMPPIITVVWRDITGNLGHSD